MEYISKISYRKAGLPRLKKCRFKNFPKRLPQADIIIWGFSHHTIAALDHVFFRYHSAYIPSICEWAITWQRYSSGLYETLSKLSIDSGRFPSNYWCEFAFTKYDGKRLLLIRPNIFMLPHIDFHLEFYSKVIDEVDPSYCFICNEAGASKKSDYLGDILATNAVSDFDRIVQSPFSPNLHFLYDFAQFFQKPLVGRALVEDLFQKLSISLQENVGIQMTPHSSHPLFYQRFKEPVASFDYFQSAYNIVSYDSYAAISKEIGTLYSALKNKEIGTLSFLGITYPWYDMDIDEEMANALSFYFIKTSQMVTMVNVARASLKVCSKI